MPALPKALRDELDRTRAYFTEADPTFGSALLPLLVLSSALYTRGFDTNFIFDEQEALLANPYVNAKGLAFADVVHRDFWGLPHDRSIGSYRPIPDVIWRLVASASRFLHEHTMSLADRAAALVGKVHAGAGESLEAWANAHRYFALNPWVFHWINVVVHAANGALVVLLVHGLSRRRGLAWLAGAIFVSAAVLTEAVSGVVGIADVTGGAGVLLALLALRFRVPAMAAGVFGAMTLALFSKESALVGVPLVPLAALLFAPVAHRERPLRALRAAVALAASVAAFVAYVELRKRWFPSPLPADLAAPLADGAGLATRASHAFLVWFHQPGLPHDPLNNPLIGASTRYRIAGALRVWARGFGQVLFPRTLAGDYSFPQEPVPSELWGAESVLGAVVALGLPLAGAAVAALSWVREARAKARGAWSPEPMLALVALGLVWASVSYFPQSNVPVLLPTVRAERFWYFPAIGTTLALACLAAWLHERFPRAGTALVVAFLGFQCARARLHANDYRDDLTFWAATREAVPRSAKAHLNYAVMWGARGRLNVRLDATRIALDLAPDWPMANIYLGDTLCRMHRAPEAYEHYRRGFVLADNDPNLIALALQCLWDEKELEPHKDDLLSLGDEHPGSWLDYLAKDTVLYGDDHQGVDPKYRPRGYNEGPKE